MQAIKPHASQSADGQTISGRKRWIDEEREGRIKVWMGEVLFSYRLIIDVYHHRENFKDHI